MHILRRLSPIVRRPFLHEIRRSLLETAESHDISRHNIPTLFVPGRHGDAIYQIVKPTIDPSFITRYANELQHSCDCRGIAIDIKRIGDIATKWWTLKNDITERSKWFQEVVHRLQSLDPECSEYDHLCREKSSFHSEYPSLRKELYEIEDIAMPLFKEIPNLIHPKTPVKSDIYHVVKAPKSFECDVISHVDIGKNLGCLEFSTFSPTAYYLSGKLAILEQAVIEFFIYHFQQNYYHALSGVDFCKSFLLEACCKDPYDTNDAITIRHKGRDKGQKQHLVGGASLESLCAYFVNMNVNKLTLPMKYHSVGRLYNASHRNLEEISLFNVVQCTGVHSMVVSECTHVDACYQSLYNLLLSCYSLLDIPFRVVEKSSRNLGLAESRKACFELWSPARKDYVMCGNVVQCDDFLSKRLQMTYGVGHKTENFLDVVHGTVVNVPVLLACVMENLLNADGTFNIPEALKIHCLDKVQ